METIDLFFDYIAFHYAKLKVKTIKLWEYYDIYMAWCKSFNKTMDDTYKQEHGKH